jgi:type I restriction enzyme R subunit
VQSKPSPYIVRLSREFRKKQTETESLLWSRLQNRQLGGVKFRRQHPIGRYIADFCCYEHKLVVEVDGGVHMEQNQRLYDRLRQEDIEAEGFKVLRVTTQEVVTDIEAVLRKISNAVGSSPPAPLPRERSSDFDELVEGVPTPSGRGEARGIYDRNQQPHKEIR